MVSTSICHLPTVSTIAAITNFQALVTDITNKTVWQEVATPYPSLRQEPKLTLVLKHTFCQKKPSVEVTASFHIQHNRLHSHVAQLIAINLLTVTT